MDKITKRFEKMMLISLIMAFLDVITGIIFIKCTYFATKVNVMILGALIVTHGLFYLIRYIYDGLGNKFFAINLIVGVAALILGIFTVFNPFNEFKIIEIIGKLFSIWLLISGIEKLYYGYRFLKRDEDIYPLTGFMGILLIIMAILSLFNPFRSFVLITKLIGIFLICSGLLEAMICNLFRQSASNILKVFK